jgi:CBS domain-containing protein
MTKQNLATEEIFFLSQLIGRKVLNGTKRLGTLTDLIIVETPKIPRVLSLIVNRPFGYPALLVPFEKVEEIEKKAIILKLADPEAYAKEPAANQILLKDYIMDKKVLDMEGNEVEIVYDVKLVLRGKNLYVSSVDFSKYGLLRRLGLQWIADFINYFADKFKEEPLSWTYVQPLSEDMSSFKGNVRLNVLKEKLPDIHPVDLADILEELDHNHRLAVFNELDTEQASDTLEEIEPRVQRELIRSIKLERTVELINEMTPAQAADVLSIIPSSDADNILELIDAENREKIRIILDQHEEKVIHFATSSFFKFAPNLKIKEAINQFHTQAKDIDIIMYIYIVDKADTLIGVLDIKELLIAESETTLEEIMVEHVIQLKPDNSLNEAAKLFSRYGFRAIPIVDNEKKIIGVVPYRDVMNLGHTLI